MVVQLHLCLTTAEVIGQLQALVALLTGKDPPVNLRIMRLGGPQNLYGRFGEEKNLLSLAGIESCHV